MQNITKRFRVTDGNGVLGQFKSRRAAVDYLNGSRFWDAPNKSWIPIKTAGFYIERFDEYQGEWQRLVRLPKRELSYGDAMMTADQRAKAQEIIRGGESD